MYTPVFFKDRGFQQSVGIPIRTNCAQLLAEFIFDSSEDDLFKEKHDGQDQFNKHDMIENKIWSKQWDRTGKYSCIDKKVLTEVMNWN